MKLIILVIAVFGGTSTVQLASVPSKNVLLLRQKEPLKLEYCMELGYRETSKINLVKRSQSAAENDRHFKALQLLDSMGCSELVKGFACAIYAPAFLKEYKTALPPCKSLCQSTEEQCSRFMPYMKKLFNKAQLYCDDLKDPGEKTGCVDYKFDEDLAKLVMVVRGNPKMSFNDWKVPIN